MAMIDASKIREHMDVVGSDGQHVGTVDKVEGDRIKLTKSDDPDGSRSHHHFIPMSEVASCDGGKVRLSMPAQQAKQRFAAGGMGRKPSQGMGL
jgi:hypothetical protein